MTQSVFHIVAASAIIFVFASARQVDAAPVFGTDASFFQGNINWPSVAADGKEFAFVKATEGQNFTDAKFVTNINGASNAGIYVSGYHLATPYTGGVNDAAAEASDFYAATSPYLGAGFMRPALDLERGSELSTTVLSDWVHDFMNAFSSLSGGVVPVIYMNTNYATNEVNSSVNIYDLWLANWTNNPNNPPAAPGIWSGVGYDLWQYSSSISVDGISGLADGNVFLGDLSEFTAKYVIPEPSTLLLLFAGSAACLRRRFGLTAHLGRYANQRLDIDLLQSG